MEFFYGRDREETLFEVIKRNHGRIALNDSTKWGINGLYLRVFEILPAVWKQRVWRVIRNSFVAIWNVYANRLLFLVLRIYLPPLRSVSMYVCEKCVELARWTSAGRHRINVVPMLSHNIEFATFFQPTTMKIYAKAILYRCCAQDDMSISKQPKYNQFSTNQNKNQCRTNVA